MNFNIKIQIISNIEPEWALFYDELKYRNLIEQKMNSLNDFFKVQYLLQKLN